MTQSARIYTDPARAVREKDWMLRTPLIAGLSQDVASPGARILFEEMGRSIIIVRSEDGQLRGFHNMCAHRGAKLVHTDETGACAPGRHISCPFHAWRYDLNGALIAVPGAAGFEGAQPAGLHPAPVAEWNGLVFVRADGHAPIDVAAHLASFAPTLEMLELGAAAPVQRSVLRAATNWKLALDTYGENYHFGVLHASTIAETHASNVATFDAFDPHYRLAFAENALASLAGKAEDAWPTAEYGAIHFIFPNTVLVFGALNAGEAFVRMFRLFPGDGPGDAICRFSVHALGLSPAEFRARFGERDDSDSVVTHEDFQVAADAYANFQAAPPEHRVVFGRNEPALQAFHRSLTTLVGA